MKTAKRIYPSLAAYLAGTRTTQDEFAKRLGITQAQVSKYLNGVRPRLDLALKIAEAANIPVESLVPAKRRVA
jgi:transcriptional regulator with XRE-family HTH domain